jgi:heme/copper-type cytochrome/quinol oxidase subunit 1
VDGPHELLAVVYIGGQALLLLVLLATGLILLRGAHTGEPAGDDPWDAQTLEWALPSPPTGAAAVATMVTSPEPLLDGKAGGAG